MHLECQKQQTFQNQVDVYNELVANVLFYLNLWTGAATAKIRRKLRKAIQLMDFLSFIQENKREGGDAVLGANLAPRGPELILFFWPSHILHGLYK